MVTLRISSNSITALRAARTLAYRTFTTNPRFQAQGYGDGKGDPIAEKPEKQPQSSKAQRSSEHPGPEPPDVGKGTGGAPTKAAFSKTMREASGEKTPEEASAQSGGSRSKEATETGGSPTGGDIANAASQKGGEALKGPQGKGSPRPKIHNQSIPGTKQGLSDEQKQEVERHNQEFDKRHDRAAMAADDKVDKKFWQGTGGRQGGEIDWNA